MENREQVVPLRGLGLGPATEAVLAASSQAGYAAAASGPGTFRLARTSRPVWAKVGAVVGFPVLGLGLLFLLIKRTESGSASVFEDRDGVKVRLVGALDAKIVDALAAIGSPAASPVPPGAGAAPSGWGPSTTAPPPPAPTAVGEMVTGVPGGVAGLTPSVASMPPSTYQPPQTSVDETMLRSPLPPPPVAPSPVPPPSGEIDVDRTIAKSALAAPRAEPAVRLVARDGSVITVGRGVVLGRQPERDPSVPDAAPTPIAEPSLSKTHATIAPTQAGVWVVDHHSTNGTTVSRGGTVASAPPGARVEVPAGSVVVLGELELRVDVA